VIYGASQSGFSAKHATGNLPLIRTESHDSKLKERDVNLRFGGLSNMPNQSLRQSHNFKVSSSQGANPVVQHSGSSQQNLKLY
jgi:hypothetical protein